MLGLIGVRIPDANYSAILKICNPESKVIKSITDTSLRKHPIPIEFIGSLKRICPNENQTFEYVVLPETLCSYVTIDSIKAN